MADGGIDTLIDGNPRNPNLRNRGGMGAAVVGFFPEQQII